MSHLVDIALDESGRMTAVAAELRLARGTLFLLLESTSADPAAAAVVQAALAAFAGTAACSSATSHARMLDQAFEAANRAAGDAIQRNRSLQGVLVSASAVLSTGDNLHVASVGANGVYLRTQGQTRRLADPETPASRLALHGLSPDETRNVDRSVVNGLGLPPEVFALRQSRTVAEPESYLLVLCGAGLDSLITPAHISTSSPATGDMSVTATRLFRQFGDKLMTPSAVLAAHRRRTSVESTPFRYSVGTGERSSRRLAGPLPFALLALAVLGILVYLYLDRTDMDTPPPPMAPPVNLLQPDQAAGAGPATQGPKQSAGTGLDGAKVPAAGSPAAPQSPSPGSGETPGPLAPPSVVEPADLQGSGEVNASAPADGGEAIPVENPPSGKVAESSRAGAGAAGPPAAVGRGAAAAPKGPARGRATASAVPGSRGVRPQPVAPAAPEPSGSTDTPSGSTDTPSGSTDTPSGSTDTPSGSTDTPAVRLTPPEHSEGPAGEQDGAEPTTGGLANEGPASEGEGPANEGTLDSAADGELQVMDFTQPDKGEDKEGATPVHRPFPAVRLEPEPLPEGGVGEGGTVPESTVSADTEL